jgi:hypothetical protein
MPGCSHHTHTTRVMRAGLTAVGLIPLAENWRHGAFGTVKCPQVRMPS